MATAKDGAVLKQLQTLFQIGAIGELSDGQLLRRFATGDGEAAERAFAALVERHGAMVLRVCRARLRDPQEAEDAFQATFLILIEKARGLWVRDSLGPWLHQVAFRTASCARSATARRRRLERRSFELASCPEPREDHPRWEWEELLHREIDRLPECYRVPIVLCDLQGHSCEEAARRMGRPVGTVKCWRSRGRQRLRDRLVRLGVAPAVGIGTLLAGPAAEASAFGLWDRLAAGEVPASVLTLIKGVMMSMIREKARASASALLALAVLAAGLGAAVRVVAAGPKAEAGQEGARPDQAAPTPASAPAVRGPDLPERPGGEAWNLRLPEAIGIGLGNSEAFRVVSLAGEGKPLVITPAGRFDGPQSAAEAMALVRSIQQQYWSLAQYYAQLHACEKAVELARKALTRERSPSGRQPRLANVLEAEQRLERHSLDVATKSADIIATERQLRRMLGLPQADGRRIIPATHPTEAKLEPDWKESLAVMMKNQPDLVRALAWVRQAEAAPGDYPPEQAKRRRALLEQVTHQTTHTLARSFLEIDANSKQYATASRLRAAALQRLEAQGVFYEEGSLPVDRYLDAVNQYTTALAQEAQFRTSYNISIVALEEAKGTLLEHEGIAVVGSRQAIAPPTEETLGRREPAEPVLTTAPAVPLPPSVPEVSPAPRPSPAAPVEKTSRERIDGGKRVSFDMTIGVGPAPIQIRGSFTVTPVEAH